MIRGKHVLRRPMEPDDLPFLQHLANDPLFAKALALTTSSEPPLMLMCSRMCDR